MIHFIIYNIKSRSRSSQRYKINTSAARKKNGPAARHESGKCQTQRENYQQTVSFIFITQKGARCVLQFGPRLHSKMIISERCSRREKSPTHARLNESKAALLSADCCKSGFLLFALCAPAATWAAYFCTSETLSIYCGELQPPSSFYFVQANDKLTARNCTSGLAHVAFYVNTSDGVLLTTLGQQL